MTTKRSYLRVSLKPTAVLRWITPVVVLLAPLVARAEPKPLWEAGLGIGGIVFPDYRGSDELKAYPIPLPYIVYRGKFLKASREGVRGQLFNRKWAELSLSVNGSVPVNSDDGGARQGMPDLKPTFELGPSLDLHLWHSPDSAIKVDLVLPLRAPITVESSPQSIGWVFAPRFNIDIQNVAGLAGWNLGLGAGPLFADDKYHDYFYSVAPRYVTTERPTYDAGGGYSGTHVLASLSKRFPGFWVGGYVRADSLHGAAFEDSPLVRQDYALSGGIGIAWMIGQSKRTVDADE
ncbi:MAG TPA: MipA/OmpV family protein [Steroidobacteraceae bacterium]|nr:MipA/OmpV family protein [Steroidobacteraceae bacterium]